MCENLSRGKLWNSGEWVEGYYVYLYDGRGNESHRIYTGYAETDCGEFYPVWGEVDPDTVGRYTGLTDGNGTKIFEGDILIFIDPETQEFDDNERFAVRWDEDGAGFLLEIFVGSKSVPFDEMSKAHSVNFEVIGNIHDNPKPLEGCAP